MKKYLMFKLLPAILLCLAVSPTSAQTKEARDYDVDSVLYLYYQRCKDSLASPSVIAMSDTLFRMAEQKGDKRMQAVALSTVLDYYYYQANLDSIIANVDRVKAFAKQTDQPKYYFFSWGSRLITFYLKANKINTALYEAEKMLKEARQMDDKQGLASCYGVMANIYKIKKNRKLVYETALKEIEIIETHGLSDYNLTNTCIDVADYYIRENQLEKALGYLQKAEKKANNNSHKVMYLGEYVSYYLKLGQNDRALAYFEELQKLFSTDANLAAIPKKLYSVGVEYYNGTHQYSKAFELLDLAEGIYKKLGEDEAVMGVSKLRGEIYFKQKNFEQAARNLIKYIDTKDSIEMVNDNNASMEFAAMLNVEELRNEKNEITLKARENEINYIRTRTIILVVCLGALILVLYWVWRVNRSLKRSKAELTRKNAALVESEKELSLAKERAEQASVMKSVFIRNMTHEIRTPLNSIVGFSQLITDMIGGKGEMQEYTDIIRESNTKLLKLVADVLDMSDLESGKVMSTEQTDINKCCQESIKEALPYVQNGVKLEFHQALDKLITNSNGQRINQVLFNLLHNACRATSMGSIVLTYSLNRASDTIVFTVTDTGTGVPADKSEEIFMRFVKLDSFSQGSGLGLSVSRLLAQKMGGDLTLDTSYRNGCRFVFTLPYPGI